MWPLFSTKLNVSDVLRQELLLLLVVLLPHLLPARESSWAVVDRSWTLIHEHSLLPLLRYGLLGACKYGFKVTGLDYSTWKANFPRPILQVTRAALRVEWALDIEFAHLMRKELGNNKIIIIISAPGEHRVVSLALCRALFGALYNAVSEAAELVNRTPCKFPWRGISCSEQNYCENQMFVQNGALSLRSENCAEDHTRINRKVMVWGVALALADD